MPSLKSHIGNAVIFKAPISLRASGARERRGKIIDEIWADESQLDPVRHDHDDPQCWGHYAFCSQLIEWADVVPNQHTIRLTYYRLACKGTQWRFAGQTAIETYPVTIKALMERTLAKPGWFQEPPSF